MQASPDLKILMLNFEYPPIGGGAGTAHLSIMNELSAYPELTIDVLTSAPRPGFVAEKHSENLTIHKVGLHKKNLHHWRKSEVIEWLVKSRSHYHRLLRENRYDLVHAFFGFPSGWLCHNTADELPYIISLRGSDVPGYNVRLRLDYKLLAGRFRRIWGRASAVVANSEGLKRLALQFLPDLAIDVIPNGVDTNTFYPGLDVQPAQPIEAVTVSRLVSRKRADLLIQCVAAAKHCGLDLRLSIAGDGILRKSLQQLAGRLSIKDRVRFLGRVPARRMPEVYRANHIFLMSSEHEGMSNAMLEAMASGLPIVTTGCEGVEELIAGNGIVVEKATAEDFLRAIKTLVENPQTYAQMANAAVRQAETFSWKSVAQKYLSCYGRVLGRTEKAKS